MNFPTETSSSTKTPEASCRFVVGGSPDKDVALRNIQQAYEVCNTWSVIGEPCPTCTSNQQLVRGSLMLSFVLGLTSAKACGTTMPDLVELLHTHGVYCEAVSDDPNYPPLTCDIEDFRQKCTKNYNMLRFITDNKEPLTTLMQVGFDQDNYSNVCEILATLTASEREDPLVLSYTATLANKSLSKDAMVKFCNAFLKASAPCNKHTIALIFLP